MKDELYLEGFTQNRELSWLKFNERVLMEASDERVPLLERLKFISIFTSNLDEFFMIRVGSLFDVLDTEKQIDSKSGLTPRQQLSSIYAAVRPLYEKRDRLFARVEQELRLHGIDRLSYAELGKKEQHYVKDYFKQSVLPILSPQIIDRHHPFPHLQNKVIHLAALLRRKNKAVFAVIPVPNTLPELVFLPGDTLRYISIESVIGAFLGQIFEPYTVSEKVELCITRNADINPEDETFDVDDDFRNQMKRVLGQRRRLSPVRLEVSQPIGEGFLTYLCEKLTLMPRQIYVTETPMKLTSAFILPSKLPEVKRKQLSYPDFSPQLSPAIHPCDSILRQVQRTDLLLSYPFESMEPFLQMMKEAAQDPTVVSIKITIYRLARKTKLVKYLCAAAENGKEVTVLIELRARFDEQNNIDWSERLEEAGCTIIYGFESYKVHSKLCLITRKERNEIKYITQIGTGNYNETTAALYTDLSLITANQEIGHDAYEFFKNMAIGNLDGVYRHLLVAPNALKNQILQMIDIECQKGEHGRIVLKLNSLTDVDIMMRLKEASCAGVQIRMIVRGICCLLPDVVGKTEHIQISSIIGRFLEHSRIYCLGTGAEERMYLSSADFMTRNTERRVEIACPIYQESVRAKIHEILEAAERDNVKARILLPNGDYTEKERDKPQVDSQQWLMEAAESAAASLSNKRGIWQRVQGHMSNLLEKQRKVHDTNG